MKDNAKRVESFSPARYAKDLGLLDASHACGAEHDAVMLLADISGFTALAERIFESHPDAPDRLSGILNDYFGRLIRCVYDVGGTIVTFVGDALIASWPAAGDASKAALQAAICAERIQRDLTEFPAPEGARLETRIAIGSGRATAARIGGFAGRWRVVVGGEPVVQLAEAIKLCRPGEIVGSATVRALTAGAVSGEEIATGCVRLMPSEPFVLHAATETQVAATMDIDPSVLRGFVADPVLRRLDASQEGWLGDVRHATCLFVGIDGIEWLRPDAWIRLQTAVVPLQKRLVEYGGALDKVLVDEKGTIVIAAFGLPPTTTDRRAQRAVAAAVAIAADVRKQGLGCDIGIASGRVFCGPVGNERRREYTLIGRSVNLAARLMQRAAGEILCDGHTYAEAGGTVRARSATTVALKGFAEPTTAYSLNEIAHEQPPAVPLATVTVGREKEIAAATALCQRALAGDGGVLVFEGEAGIGKSHIIATVATIAATSGIRCLRSSGQAIEALNPWHAWRSVFAELFAIDLRASADERAGRLAAGLGKYGGSLDLMPLLNPVFGLELPDTDLTHPMVGDARASGARSLLIGVLKRAAGATPIAILVDDAHWIDSASWGLLADASRVNAAIAIVVMMRPIADPQDSVREVLATAGPNHLKLSGLDHAQTQTFVAQLFGRERVEGAVAEWLYERGEGNPYLTQELAFALREAGVFAQGTPMTDAEMVSRLASLSLPKSVEQVIALRIDGLDAAEQLALKAASVIGPTFSLGMLERIHPIEHDRPHLRRIADNLVRAHMIEPEAGQGDDVYSFRHRITQEGAYSMMLGEQRRALHASMAHELERRHAGGLTPYFSLLAHHWGSAEVDDKALSYLETAGEQALGAGAYLEAYRLFSQAVTRACAPGSDATLADDDRRAAWHRNLAEAHYGLGNAGDNIAECKRTLALLGWRVPATHAAGTVSLLRHGAVVAAWSVLPSLLYKIESPSERKRTQIAAMAAHRMANAAFTEKDAMLTVLGAVMSTRLAMRTDAFVNSARCKSGLAIALGMSGIRKPAIALFEGSIAEAESIEDLEGLTYAHYARALYYATIGGHWTEVDADVERALGFADRLGDVQERQITLMIAATSRFLRSEFEESWLLYDRLLETAIPRRHHQHVAWAYDAQSRARARQGRFDEAVETWHRFRALLPKLQNDGVSEFNTALGAVYFPTFLGNWAEAVAQLPGATTALESLGSPFWALTITFDLFGDALELMGRDGAAHVDGSTLDDAERVFLKRLSWHARRVPNAGAIALLHRGRAALRQSRRAKAKRLANAALVRANGLGNPFDAARARLLLADVDDRATDAAREHLRAAAQVFERCSAAAYRSRCG